MKYVEIIGLPGCGKTTLKRELIRLNNSLISFQNAYVQAILHNGKKIQNLFEKPLAYFENEYFSGKFFRFLIFKYGLKKKIIQNLLSEHQDRFSSLLKIINNHFEIVENSDKEYFKSALIGFEKAYQRCILIEHNKSKKVAVIDEGILKAAQGLFAPPKNDGFEEDLLLDYLSKISLPKITIYIKAPIESCIENMVSRKEGSPIGYLNYDKDLQIQNLKLETIVIEYCVNFLRENHHEVLIYKYDNPNKLDFQRMLLEKVGILSQDNSETSYVF